MASFLIINRESPEFGEMLRSHHKEYILLSFIIRRIKLYNDDSKVTSFGEALIGDHDSCGLTRQQYRTALNNLKEWQYLTTRSTNRGTVARLIDSSIFDISKLDPNHQTNQTSTSQQPSGNHLATSQQPLIKSKEYRDKSKEDIKLHSRSLSGDQVKSQKQVSKKPLDNFSQQAQQLFQYFGQAYEKELGVFELPQTITTKRSWLTYADRLLKRDQYEVAVKVIDFAARQLQEYREGVNYTFRVESIKSLYDKYDRLKTSMNNQQSKAKQPDTPKRQGGYTSDAIDRIKRGESDIKPVGESIFGDDWGNFNEVKIIN